MKNFFLKLKKDKVPYFTFWVLVLLYFLILFADFNAMRQQLKASASADIKNGNQ